MCISIMAFFVLVFDPVVGKTYRTLLNKLRNLYLLLVFYFCS